MVHHFDHLERLPRLPGITRKGYRQASKHKGGLSSGRNLVMISKNITLKICLSLLGQTQGATSRPPSTPERLTTTSKPKDEDEGSGNEKEGSGGMDDDGSDDDDDDEIKSGKFSSFTLASYSRSFTIDTL